MNILISLTSFNADHARYLQTVLDNYSSSYGDYDLTFVLSTNYPFECKANNVIRPENKLQGHEHTWNNREYIINSGSNYAYIIETDDDVLIPRSTFEWYRANETVSLEYIPGFYITEQNEGKTYNLYGDTKPLIVNGETFSTPLMMQHSAGFIIDQERFKNLKYFHTKPFRYSFYDVQAFARTELYCIHNMKKVLPVNPRDAMALHLPNKYVPLNKQPFSVIP